MLPDYGTDLYKYRGRRFTSQIVAEIAAKITTALTGFDFAITDIATIEIEPDEDGVLDILINGDYKILVAV